MLNEAKNVVIDSIMAPIKLRKSRNSIVVFCSARELDHDSHVLSRNFGQLAAHYVFPLFSGGGSGIMDIVSDGHYCVDNGKKGTFGATMDLLGEKPSRYLTHEYRFRSFYTRKLFEFRMAESIVCLPGGAGTLDEVFEALTLMQTNKLRKKPIIFVGEKYWFYVKKHIQHLVKINALSDTDVDAVHVVGSAEEAIKLCIKERKMQEFVRNEQKTYSDILRDVFIGIGSGAGPFS